MLLALKTNRFSHVASFSGALSFHDRDFENNDLEQPAFGRGSLERLRIGRPVPIR